MSNMFLSLLMVGVGVTSRAPVYSNIFELPEVTAEPDTDTTLPGIMEGRDFQPIFEMEEMEEILDNSLEEMKELPRTNKALLRNFVDHQFVNSKHLAVDDNHLDKALVILDQLNDVDTVDSSGNRDLSESV